MMHNKLLKAAISRYEAQRDEAKAHLHILFKNSVGIGEHTDILAEIDKWVKSLSEANENLQTLLDNFDDYLKKNLMNLELMKQVKEWEEDGFTPDYFIKCDDMYGSLMEIPELKEKAEELGDELFFTINTPDYDVLGKGRQRLVEGGWKQYWNQELVDNILANKYLKRLLN